MRFTRGLSYWQNTRLWRIHLICYAVQKRSDRALNEVDLVVDPTQLFDAFIDCTFTIFKTKIIGLQFLL
jgi:hypothetical protein